MGNLNTKMTALADEIRELSGTATTKSIDAMATDVGAANTEISEQMELIAQISTALEGKAAGSGGEDVTEETTAYTTKIGQLETAVAALESELEGKASGGSSEGVTVETCTLNFTGSGYYQGDVVYGTFLDTDNNQLFFDSVISNGLKVVCDSFMMFDFSSFTPSSITSDSSTADIYELNGCWCMDVYAEPGDVITITIT